MAVQIDLDQLKFTNRDIIDFQRIVGKSIDSAFRPESGAEQDWNAITALLWILKRKHEPGFTYDDALDMEVNEEMFTSLVPTQPAPATNGAGSKRTKSKA